MSKSLKYYQSIYDRYLKSDMYSIFSAYIKPSTTKQIAFNEILDIMSSLNGKSCRIISYNSQMFTCGFIWHSKNGKKFFAYYTKSKTMIFQIGENEKIIRIRTNNY